MPAILLDVVLATLPAWLLAAVTWRIIWPTWKRWGKLALHPCLYLGLALLIGHWSVPVAWAHQGLGLAGHIWFSRKHGFTWYAVEDPDRYVALSKAAVAALGSKETRSARQERLLGEVSKADGERETMSQGSGSPAGFGPARFETGDPMLFAGLRRRHAFAAAEPGVAAQWRELGPLPRLPGRIGSNLYGVMCGADATGFEYMCAAQVESFAALPEGLGRMRVPAQRYAVFTHPGDSSTLRSTWQRIFEWLASGRYESAHLPDFEVYGPGTDPLGASPTAGAIEVWVGVKDRGEGTGSE